MERQSSTFEYLCRVCAANTKGKNSVAECVYILKTPALKDKIERYLYLTIYEDDILPKVLCKACFRQVEATASLSKIAKHTQKVFRDFIFNTKSCLQAESGDSNTAAVTTTAPASTPIHTTDYATAAPPPQEKPKPKEKEKSPMKSVEPTPPAQAVAPSTACSHKDEVVVNVSVNDPLTRETQHKMITASRRQNSLDSRFTPKSIAQRGFTSTPKQPESTTAPAKKQSTPGVINFFPNRPQQVTKITSGGYVIDCVANSVPPNNATAEATPTVNTLQQKRKNLKTALNNIKAANTGQVSLLKVSQKPAPAQVSQPPAKVAEPPTLLVEDDVPAEPLPEKMIIAATKQQKHQVHVAAAPQPTPPAESESEPQTQTEPTDLSQPSRPSIPDDILLGKVIKDGDLLKLILKALKWPVNKYNMEAQLNRLRNSRFAHIMADQNLLQDADLTQIMGPYLGPVLQAAQMLQQQQIAAAAAAAAVTKETELQVAGITTSLPYKLPAETSVQLVPASPEAEEESEATAKASASNQSLKRGAEKMSTKAAPSKKVRKVAPRQRSASIFNSDEYAALNSTLTSQYLSSKSTPDFHVDLDPSALFTQLGMLSGLSASSSNEALLALLQRQRIALSRLQQPQPRRQRSNSIITVPASGSDFVFDTDDIILMEPDDCTESITTSAQNNVDGNTGSASSVSQNDSNSTFPVPQQVSKPMITRPIIKRRKTVIQASPARTNLAIKAQEVTPAVPKPAESVINTATTTKVAASVPIALPSVTAAVAAVAAAVPQKKPSKTQSLDSLNVIATQYPSNIISVGTQVPSNTTNATTAKETVPVAIVTKATETSLTVTASAATSVSSLVANAAAPKVSTTSTVVVEKSTTRSNSTPKRQSSNKSALGQQLLEAIGLQKVTTESKDVTVVPAAATGTRGSIQQIRSALKKSLQKAQEQQQQRNKKGGAPAAIGEESTESNVNIVREVVVQPRGKHASNLVGQLDVEEEINKITLVLQSKAKEDKKIEQADKRLTAAAPTRIPGIRRKIVPTTRNRKSAITLVADEIVDLVADEDNQDAADGKSVDKEKIHEKDKGKETATKSSKDQSDAYLMGASLTSLQRSHRVDPKESKTVTPVRKRGRNLKPEEESEEEEDDEDDNKPLKVIAEKNADDKLDVYSRTSTPAPRQRSRPPPANNVRKAPSERDFEKESDDTASVKNDNESTTSTITSSRPSRVSKTMSKYYKGPDKSPSTQRRSAISTRSRVRN
ncbi:uncharacterized protein LOC129248497 [Anastrepha obliqua]|uniref:uncharacterized protein LOC129248497 n=1 Tax=Anastrepha obliqua TaxID=95512 RepID=UPI0024096B9C|nr:uncharacterized protein LOC129248497 [Anastrepha obliqua]XP_054744036.1 uncharacterized protein LOC129248497 [Anastrepha obliqua]